MASRVGWRAEAVPRRAPVAPDVPALDALLEKRESSTHDRAKARGLHGVELLLRVVEIVNVNRSHTQVRLTPLDLMREKGRGERVASTHEVVGADNAGVEKSLLEVREVLFSGGRG